MHRLGLFTLLATCLSLSLAFPTWHGGGLKRSGRVYRPAEKRAAEPYSPQFPYTGATINGLPGTQIGGVLVPATGDTAHEFQNPPAGAMRGPCPGLNVAANHGFISRDGITTLDELVAAQQNIYNIGYDLAVVTATLAVVYDGDIITEKLSIGGDATSQTAPLGISLGPELGLDGHDTFESDASLTRNDFFLANGDDHSFNGTLFKMMTDTVATTSSASAPLYDLQGLGLYRGQRYDQSLAENGQFDFSPARGLVQYGAASFLYELMPSAANGSIPDKATISSFFGAVEDSSGDYSFVPERIPPNWVNRVASYTLLNVVGQILEMYLIAPRLFGQNAGVGHFEPVEVPISTDTTPEDLACLLYQVLTENIPDSLSDVTGLLAFLTGKINPMFAEFGCPLVDGTGL